MESFQVDIFLSFFFHFVFFEYEINFTLFFSDQRNKVEVIPIEELVSKSNDAKSWMAFGLYKQISETIDEGSGNINVPLFCQYTDDDGTEELLSSLDVSVEFKDDGPHTKESEKEEEDPGKSFRSQSSRNVPLPVSVEREREEDSDEQSSEKKRKSISMRESMIDDFSSPRSSDASSQRRSLGLVR